MNYIYLIPIIFLLVTILLLVFFHFKKKSVIKKINSLSIAEKTSILNDVADGLGYVYDASQDIFSTRLDAIQKRFGYATLYDKSAPYFNMIFDTEVFYFNYDGKTWRIQLWKGQYGINAGCELGIYYTDEIISPDKYDSTLFKVAENTDMLDLFIKLNSECQKKPCPYAQLGRLGGRHWWITIFKPGVFFKPKQLFTNVSITFKNYKMMYSFLESFRTALPNTPYKTNRTTVYFNYYKSQRKYSFFKRLVRGFALLICRFYCFIFNKLTNDFTKSGDKILYIYYYVPILLRKLF